MDILILDIFGRFAHFRKFYTNSSSLSYSIPPRTVLMGLMAALLGYERDSYYDIFSSDKLNISLRKMEKTRKIMQSINYIKATSMSAIINPREHTQIPFEIITGEKGLHYRVYLSHKDTGIIDELEKRAKEKKFVYSPYLGAAPFNCSISYVARANGECIKEENAIETHSPLNSELIDKIDIKGSNLFLVKERMPCDMTKERNIKKVCSYIFDENCSAVKVKLKCCSYSINYSGMKEDIVFM